MYNNYQSLSVTKGEVVHACRDLQQCKSGEYLALPHIEFQSISITKASMWPNMIQVTWSAFYCLDNNEWPR